MTRVRRALPGLDRGPDEALATLEKDFFINLLILFMLLVAGQQLVERTDAFAPQADSREEAPARVVQIVQGGGYRIDGDPAVLDPDGLRAAAGRLARGASESVRFELRHGPETPGRLIFAALASLGQVQGAETSIVMETERELP